MVTSDFTELREDAIEGIIGYVIVYILDVEIRVSDNRQFYAVEDGCTSIVPWLGEGRILALVCNSLRRIVGCGMRRLKETLL